MKLLIKSLSLFFIIAVFACNSKHKEKQDASNEPNNRTSE